MLPNKNGYLIYVLLAFVAECVCYLHDSLIVLPNEYIQWIVDTCFPISLQSEWFDIFRQAQNQWFFFLGSCFIGTDQQKKLHENVFIYRYYQQGTRQTREKKRPRTERESVSIKWFRLLKLSIKAASRILITINQIARMKWMRWNMENSTFPVYWHIKCNRNPSGNRLRQWRTWNNYLANTAASVSVNGYLQIGSNTE